MKQRFEQEEKEGFLSFSYGVWVCSWARNNLLTNLIKLDKNVLYADTDSLKLFGDYDKMVIENYNKLVEEYEALYNDKIKMFLWSSVYQ